MQVERSAVGPGNGRVDAVALQRTVKRLCRQGQAPWLHAEAARRMAERLPFIRKQPSVLIDCSGPLGASSTLLRAAYPQARHLALRAAGEPAVEISRKPWWSIGRKTDASIEWIAEAALAGAQAELLWSNMALQGHTDPQAVFAQWHQALADEGFLMFSTLGPGSLPELRDIHRRNGWGDALLPFVDMHDLGDMLVHAGFSDPVMDQELLTVTWPDANALLAELRGVGANVSPQRFGGLRTPRWRQRLTAELDARAVRGRPSLTFELVYGHAFRATPKPRLQPETNVSLAEMRSMIRASRP